MAKSIYLDYAAATPLGSEVLKAMKPYFTDKFYNPSAAYLAGRGVRQAVNDARAVVAQHLGARPPEIVFTAGATEANNLAVRGVMEQFPGHEVLASAIEHESVLAPVELYNHRLIPVSTDGIINLEALTKMISPKTILVSLMMVNNELGTIQPLRQVAALLRTERQRRAAAGELLPLYFHSDAAQAINYLDLHISRLGVDLMTINGGKIYGPKQTGALLIKSGVHIKPQIIGGGQENGFRSGTENTPGQVGLAKALEIAAAMRLGESKRLSKLRTLFISLIEEMIPLARINGSKKHIAPHIIHLTIPGTDNEQLMMELDEAGIECAVGSACSAANLEPSHVLKAIGLSDKEAYSSLRFSLGRQTTAADIVKTVQTLAGLTGGNKK